MLAVQKYLHEHGLAKLVADFAVKVTENPLDDRILLNYNQIESPKSHPVIRNCRGLCLNKNDFSIISKSFDRFYNFTEHPESDNRFDWSDCVIQEKCDGTLLNVFFYEGEWRVQTRGSFGNIPFYEKGPTPESLFWDVLRYHQKRNVFHQTHLSFSFELCSRHNKVVRDYPETKLYLLSAFRGHEELPFDGGEYNEGLIDISKYMRIETPERFQFHSIGQVENFIRERAKGDPTFEGCVLRDKNNVRIKVKNPSYLSLHRLGSDKACLFLPKNLLPFILSNETAELLCHFKETEPKIREMERVLSEEYKKVEETWERIKNLPTRKEFALAVPKDLKCKSLLFQLLDSGLPLKEVWRESSKPLLKCLFNC